MRLPHNSTETSVEAAESAVSHAGFQKERVYNEIRRRGIAGATNDELSVALDLTIQTVCPRANELFQEGRIQKSGVKRLTRSDRRTEAWILGSDSKLLPVEPELVKIKIWRVSGQQSEIGVFFTHEAACAANAGACSGWGDVEEEIVLAILA